MAKSYLIDTSAYSAFNRGDERLKPWFVTSNILVVPHIVIGELRAGFVSGTRLNENERLLQKFLDAPNVTPLGLSDETTKSFAKVYLQLRRSGTPIGTNDLWIASMAIELDLPLITLDKDFSHVKGLKLVKL